MLKIYHNPRCSKSRETLKIIQDQNADVEIVEYLNEIPTASELKAILDKLGLEASQIIRKGEPIFKERFKGKNLTNDEWISAMVEFPKLMERPIVVKGDEAVLGRPPGNVLKLL
jgi:arsenate reductase (glutaredoxin)